MNQNAAPPNNKSSAQPITNEAEGETAKPASKRARKNTDASGPVSESTSPKGTDAGTETPASGASAQGTGQPNPAAGGRKEAQKNAAQSAKEGAKATELPPEAAAAKEERRRKRRELQRLNEPGSAPATTASEVPATTAKSTAVATKTTAQPAVVPTPQGLPTTAPAPKGGLQKSPRQTQKIAGPARRRPRHTLLMLSFILWVIAPLGGVGWYLYTIAQDQYASYVGFAVRSEEVSSGIEILGGITELSGNSSSDTDILYKFIQGRQMIEAVNKELDLRAIYNKPNDPVFALDPDAPIEEIESYWRRVVKVFYDTQSGLLELRIVAFDPHDAQNVAQAIVDESTRIINELTAIARTDTTQYAQDELDRAIGRLKIARQALNTFRARTQIVDPFADTQGHLGLLNNLQTQLATALIDLDMIRLTARDNDPRIQQEERRVDVIRKRIAAERNRFGSEQEEDSPDDTYSRLVGEYEVLAVDLEFASKSYLSALAAYDSAVADAQRKSRYLAAYVRPTLAQSPEYPQRALLMILIFSALLLSWTIFMLIYYSVRDRR